MKTKRSLLILPAVLLPYVALMALAVIFFSADLPMFARIMESVFDNNGLILIAALLGYCLIAAALSIFCFFRSICKKWDALSLAKTAVIVKLVQIPAYIGVFVVGVLCTITVFTIPFTVGVFLLDCVTLFLSGLLTSAAVINAVRQNNRPFKQVFWVILLQFVFCADVVAAILFYHQLKKDAEHSRATCSST